MENEYRNSKQKRKLERKTVLEENFWEYRSVSVRTVSQSVSLRVCLDIMDCSPHDTPGPRRRRRGSTTRQKDSRLRGRK